MRIAENDLNRIKVARARNVGKGGDRHVAGEWSFDAVRKQPAAAPLSCRRVRGTDLQDSRRPKALRAGTRQHARTYRPTTRNSDRYAAARRAELAAQGADGFDFDLRLEHAAFQLNFAKSVLIDHLAALANQRFRASVLRRTHPGNRLRRRPHACRTDRRRTRPHRALARRADRKPADRLPCR